MEELEVEAPSSEGAFSNEELDYVITSEGRVIQTESPTAPFYVISDTHFGHDNIVKVLQSPRES